MSIVLIVPDSRKMINESKFQEDCLRSKYNDGVYFSRRFEDDGDDDDDNGVYDYAPAA